MFKNVEYSGFENNPELKELADRAVATLSDVVREWAPEIDLELEAYPDRPAGVEVALTLNLPAASGRGARFLTRDEFASAETLENRCRAVWGRAMDAYIEQRKRAWAEIVDQPAEV